MKMKSGSYPLAGICRDLEELDPILDIFCPFACIPSRPISFEKQQISLQIFDTDQ